MRARAYTHKRSDGKIAVSYLHRYPRKSDSLVIPMFRGSGGSTNAGKLVGAEKNRLKEK